MVALRWRCGSFHGQFASRVDCHESKSVQAPKTRSELSGIRKRSGGSLLSNSFDRESRTPWRRVDVSHPILTTVTHVLSLSFHTWAFY